MKKIILRLLFAIALCCFLYSSFQLAKYGWETYQTKKNLSALTDYIDNSVYTGTETDSASSEDPNPVQELSPEELAALQAKEMQHKYGKLYKENPDFFGWLSIDDTPVNYPVMYTPDDPEKYLRKNFNKEYDIAGMLFVDARCTFNPYSTNTIIYGHRMKNATMFGPLRDYKDEDFFYSHQMLTFDTLLRPGRYKVFCTFLSKAYDNDSSQFKYYDFVQADTEEEWNTYIDNIKALSMYYDTDNAPVFGDEILTLSTCDYYTTDGRFVVLAKRLP